MSGLEGRRAGHGEGERVGRKDRAGDGVRERAGDGVESAGAGLGEGGEDGGWGQFRRKRNGVDGPFRPAEL